MRTTRPLVALLLLVAGGGAPAAGQAAADSGYDLVQALMSESPKTRREASRRLVEGRRATLLPGIVDALFFIPRTRRDEAYAALEAISGERPGRSYAAWVELVGRRTDLEPAPGYLEWKVSLLERIDPSYRKILYSGAPSRVRLEEVVWGGVRVGGIPALENPAHVAAEQATYLRDGERVFGALVGGEARAYPLRIMDWHEMANDVLGGQPVTLSYCTLCGSGVLFATATPTGSAYTFGTSGLLYRSNKLMFDRQTYSLWSNLTGVPVVGRLGRSPFRLTVLPLALTTWGAWRRLHPQTTVLALDLEMARRWDFDYRPGAADRRRSGVSFPVWLKSPALPADGEVFALRLGALAKAYPLDLILARRVINDQVGEETVVVVGDPASGAVRAYRRGTHSFRSGSGDGELLDETGSRWRLLEEELRPAAGGDERCARLPGHNALWFGWYAFFPQAELYSGGGR